MNSTAIVTINLSALRHNLNLIREKMPHQKIMAMVKSNAYGHGLIRVAETIKEVDAFGVATIAEAMQLKEAAIKTDIVVMRGFLTDSELRYFFDDPQLLACIHDENQIVLLEAIKTNVKRLRI
jgi:alanine racemase